MKLPSYGKIMTLGDTELQGLFLDEVVITEKVDGSQFSFGIVGKNFLMRSKGQPIGSPADNTMFKQAAQTAANLHGSGFFEKIAPTANSVIVTCEVVSKPRHNILTYGRVPEHGIVIFDIRADYPGDDVIWGTPNSIRKICEPFGLEVVPVIYEGMIRNQAHLEEVVDIGQESCLGGTPIEGVVIKNYSRRNKRGNKLFAKWVSDEFKEVKSTPRVKKGQGSMDDFLDPYVEAFGTDARMDKAIIHCREEGSLVGGPRDIPVLMKSLSLDIMDECEDDLRDAIWKVIRKRLMNRLTKGMPSYYLARLQEEAFDGDQTS